MKNKNHPLWIIAMIITAQFICQLSVKAQVPLMFNYQGIARDQKGNPISNQTMSLKIAILPDANAVNAEYEETQSVSTNEFGLYTLQIGAGKAVSGTMQTVKWESGSKYVRVAVDPIGGSNYVTLGTSQLLSVPYALFAGKVAENNENEHTRAGTVVTAAAGTGTTNFLTKFTAANTIYNSQIFDNGTNIGIGTVSPVSRLHLYNSIGNVEHIRMQNANESGYGKFLMHNDIPANYATFTKYGSAYPGGYAGVASQFPFANMLAFGNNMGPFLLANNGNVGLGIVTAGTTKLYINAQQSSGYLGIGGSALPAANVHVNNSSTGDTLRITNATTGHTAGDGIEIRNTGNVATIMNNENSTLNLGTYTYPSILRLTPSGNAEISGLLKIAGGSPSFGYVLTSDATGLASWQVPAGTLPNGAAAGNTPYWNGSIWVVNSSHLFNNGSRVGIGATAPLSKMHVKDSSGNLLLVENSGLLAVNHSAAQYFKAGNLYTGAIKTVGTSTTAARMGFYTNADTFATDLMERMTISESGSVGIGDTAPFYKLDVNGTIHGNYLYSSGGLEVYDYASFYSGAYIDGELTVGQDANFIANVDVQGEMTVSNGQGIVKSNTSAQRNIGYTYGAFAYTNMASNAFGDVTFALPNITGTVNSLKVSIAQFVPAAGSGDGWRKFLLTPHSIDIAANTCKISVYNSSGAAASINGTLHLLVVYND
jgi:hypothetical protein